MFLAFGWRALRFGCRIAQASDGNLFLVGELICHRRTTPKSSTTTTAGRHHITQGTGQRRRQPREAARRVAGSLSRANTRGATIGPDGKLWMHRAWPAGRRRKSICPSPGATTAGLCDHLRVRTAAAERWAKAQPAPAWSSCCTSGHRPSPSGMAFPDQHTLRRHGRALCRIVRLAPHRLEVAGGKVQREESCCGQQWRVFAMCGRAPMAFFIW